MKKLLNYETKGSEERKPDRKQEKLREFERLNGLSIEQLKKEIEFLKKAKLSSSDKSWYNDEIYLLKQIWRKKYNKMYYRNSLSQRAFKQ
jgi:hypothetical protein